MTENWYPEADPNRDRTMPLWPKLPAVPAAGAVSGAVSGGSRQARAMNRPWARRLATVAAAVALSLGGGAVVGAAAVRLETDTVAVAGPAPDAAPAARSGAAVAGAASVTVVGLWSGDV